MIEVLANKSASGELFINMAQRHMENHEWGLARIFVEKGIFKGGLSEPSKTMSMLEEAHRCLGIYTRETDTRDVVFAIPGNQRE